MMRTSRTGFSLIETVIVILILGIIAAVAAPRILDTTTAEQATTRQQLTVLRTAIEMYRTRSGVYPPRDELPRAMASMLNAPFPSPSIGSVRGDQTVFYDSSSDASSPVSTNSAQPGGWAYKPANGSLKLNVESREVGAEW